jgi:hypothetical protein
VALAMSAPVKPLHAQSAQPTTRLVFHAPSGCSSPDDFAARVRRRSHRIVLSTETGAERSLVVEIRELPRTKRFHGSVSVLEAGTAATQRELQAKSCEEAVEALSLIATVTLDPDALLEEPEPEAAPEPASPPPRQSVPAAVAPPPIRHESPRASEPAHAERTRVSFGAEATLLVRFAPRPALGGTLFAAFELPKRGWLAPSFRFSVAYAEARRIAEPGGHASFAFWLPSFDVCPLRAGPAVFSVRPCAFASAGVVEAWGNRTARNETHDRFFGSAGALLWASVRIGKALEIVADGRAGVPWVRDTFGFDGVGFFATAAPIFSAALGVAGGFP